MRLAVYLALAVTLVLSGLLRPTAARVRPRPAAAFLAIGSLAIGLLWVSCLGLLAVATVGRASIAGALGHWSAVVIDESDPVPVVAGLASLLVLCLITVTLFVTLRRLGREIGRTVSLVRATRNKRAGDLAIIDHPKPEAFALPGWHGSVVVTSGMLRCLDRDERRVLLAHERSHVRGRHWLFRIAARLGAAMLPTLRSAVPACDHALERWADEDAVAAVGSRRLVARAVARAALAAPDRHTAAVLTSAISDGAAVQRVGALMEPEPHSHWRFPIGFALIGAFALIAAVEAEADLERMFELAKHVWVK